MGEWEQMVNGCPSSHPGHPQGDDWTGQTSRHTLSTPQLPPEASRESAHQPGGGELGLGSGQGLQAPPAATSCVTRNPLMIHVGVADSRATCLASLEGEVCVRCQEPYRRPCIAPRRRAAASLAFEKIGFSSGIYGYMTTVVARSTQQ